MTIHMQPDIGTDFVGYRIEELIGRGGMGVVYRAYDLRLKRTVALKLIAPEFARDEFFRARFARETELAMALEHPNVVPIYDAGDVDGRLYLAMRLVEGADLSALLRSDGALPPARAFAICRQVGAALDAAHAKGQVHRDVKPSNVLVDQDDHVYVADLGLSRRLEEQAAPGLDDRSIGTPAYLAPEQITGASIDRRVDVYSLGCLLFQCLTGELPFGRDSRLAMAWAHLEEEPPRATERNAELPAEIDAVLRRALAKSPEQRYVSCAALMDDAQQALGLGRPPAVRRRRLMLLAAVIVVALAAVTVPVEVVRHSGGAAAAPAVRPNTLVRIDPAKNAISEVIEVDSLPYATAVGGDSVWVYNHGEGSVSEIDPATNAVRRTVTLEAAPVYIGLPYGPVLAADAGGAWVVGIDRDGGGFLTNIREGEPRKREHRLDVEPKAVAVGAGAVWVLGNAGRRDELLRVDPGTGTITAHRRFDPSLVLDSMTAGLGAVWVVAPSRGVLYRIDPRTLAVTGHIVVGSDPSRPAVRYGDIWVGTSVRGRYTIVVDPKTMQQVAAFDCCPPEEGSAASGFGSNWTISWPTGVVVRFDARTKQGVGTVHVTESPLWGAPCMTSIAAGAGAVWVTVAQSSGYACSA